MSLDECKGSIDAFSGLGVEDKTQGSKELATSKCVRGHQRRREQSQNVIDIGRWKVVISPS